MWLVVLFKMLRRIRLVDLNYKVKNLFPISIHQFEINDFDDMKGKLIDYAYDSKEKDSVGVTFSNIGGWQSRSLFRDPNLSKDDLINNFLVDFLSELPFVGNQFRYRLDAWININKNGDSNMPHVHPTSHLSGVMWLKCPKNCGQIVFTSPYEFVGAKEYEIYSDDFQKEHSSYTSYHFNPTEGCIILFPSHLLHHVNPNKSNEDRISVAFNMSFQ